MVEAETLIVHHSTGVAGATGILQAIIERSEKGGSYVVDVSHITKSKIFADHTRYIPGRSQLLQSMACQLLLDLSP